MNEMTQKMIETVWMCMEEIRSNLEMSSDTNDIIVNIKAIETLVDVYKTLISE